MTFKKKSNRPWYIKAIRFMFAVVLSSCVTLLALAFIGGSPMFNWGGLIPATFEINGAPIGVLIFMAIGMAGFGIIMYACNWALES